MCGRFYIEEEDNEEILRIVRRLDERFQNEKNLKTGEIYPTNTVAILTNEKDSLVPKAMTWGFPGFKGKEVIINARSESASEKRLFSEPLLTKRVAIPSSGFFEWNRNGDKQKYYIKNPEERILYMGGLYQVFNEGERFVILTTAANDSMKEIHHRMPIILSQTEVEPFILNYNDALNIINHTPRLLWKEKVSSTQKESYEQLSFDFK